MFSTRTLRLMWGACLAAVIVGSLLPGQSPVMGLLARTGINDKVEHFTAYAVLIALPAMERFRCRRQGATIIFLFLLGAALEVGQLFSPGRDCDWHDLLANSCGILAGLALVRIPSLACRRYISCPPPATFSPPAPPSSEPPRS